MVTQTAPDPVALRSLVERITYKAGWRFHLLDDFERGQGSRGMTPVITIDVANSYNPGVPILVDHYMIVPAAAFDERSWKRWLFEQVLLVERHEAAEFFKIDGSRPYAPVHKPGTDPYAIFEVGTLEDAQTDHRGVQHDVSV